MAIVRAASSSSNRCDNGEPQETGKQVRVIQEELLVGTAVNSWKLVVSRLDQTVASFDDQDLQLHIASGRNRVFYLVGHLTAVHDRMFPMLGLGERMHPELDQVFLDKPDHGGADAISPADLRKAFSEVNTKLSLAFEAVQAKDWLQKHNAVSDEDFAKEPLRNRLAVLMNRTNHASFHLGQMILAKR